jgi:hypothetical protein
MIVGRKRGRLQDENILAANVFLDFNEDFLIGETPDRGSSQGDVEITGDRFGQHPVGIAREEFHSSFLEGILSGF